MFLLKNEYLYAIKADVFCLRGDEEYTESNYISIDTREGKNLLIFTEKINANLRVFDTEREAENYVIDKMCLHNSCDNIRIVKVMYDFEKRKWIDSEER